ncbi:hypothetical protein [Nonomuraea sp. AD125B]
MTLREVEVRTGVSRGAAGPPHPALRTATAQDRASQVPPRARIA